LTEFFNGFEEFCALAERRDESLYVDHVGYWPGPPRDDSLRRRLFRCLLERSDTVIFVRHEGAGGTGANQDFNEKIRTWPRLPSNTTLDSIVDRSSIFFFASDVLVTEALGISACHTFNNSSIVRFNDTQRSIVVRLAYDHYNGTRKTDLDVESKNQGKTHSRATSHAVKLLQQYGVVIKLAILSPDKTYTSRLWLTVFGPRPRTTAYLQRKRRHRAVLIPFNVSRNALSSTRI
jgi:hypothetical protein